MKNNHGKQYKKPELIALYKTAFEDISMDIVAPSLGRQPLYADGG
jgi:hypothetical protein